ncbi:hypothetical protein DFS34DRAFT_649180 [Phlyctochytrium arcticum]|nr:hypothetical protein DFS34DRAFT_649180 [Phlyctochytrium arcticum]
MLDQGPRHLDIHRLLFIQDILAASNTPAGFQIGTLLFSRVRICGIITHAPTDDFGLTNYQTVSIHVDDGTAGIQIRLSIRKFRSQKGMGVKAGARVEVLGSVCESTDGLRWIECQGIKHPTKGTLRQLQTLHLYQTCYFSSSSLPPSTHTFSNLLARLPHVPSVRRTVPRTKSMVEKAMEDLEPFAFASQREIVARSHLPTPSTLPNQPQPPDPTPPTDVDPYDFPSDDGDDFSCMDDDSGLPVDDNSGFPADYDDDDALFGAMLDADEMAALIQVVDSQPHIEHLHI